MTILSGRSRAIWLLTVLPWLGAGWVVYALLRGTGWFAVAIIGAATLLIAARVELDGEAAATIADPARRLYLARSFGIALAALGLNMWLLHGG